MKKKKEAGFVKQLDTKILIRLGILHNSRPEQQTPVWQQTHTGAHRDKKRLTKRSAGSLEWKKERRGEEGANRDIPGDLILLKVHKLLLYDERQSAEKGKNNCFTI